MRKIAIIVGHNKRGQGAVRVTDGKTEFQWNSDLASRIRAYAEDDPYSEVRIFYRQTNMGYTKQIQDVYARADAWGADVTIELHFNAAADASASYTCTLSSGTAGSLALCERLQAAQVRVMGLDDAGVKIRNRGGGRGWRSLWTGDAPAALIEPYFGSNPRDCILADKRKDELARALYEAARESVA
ncbi:N-acetylmuramoyl-L-alanine amidase [Roseovarius halotolerans]|uniref:N-acetylmuramoyl-L-alanine amidase n=1 Tax=Roseovarius halotolerans TaxID=505353 RepID=A0A1X6Y696_9RHOB|nr:N-acetylmuramoyl-L-alanine amidase [Roseovarius halotolerans]RKT35282.1 N-acetylmuramoyl-L-alanine amidase [Roseovarius halotolerans]SLN11291.1 N-acetylmuramoyl-L-alanine amidase [Roseovarius halotolerans]